MKKSSPIISYSYRRFSFRRVPLKRWAEKVFPISEKQPVRIVSLYGQIEAFGLWRQGGSYYE